MPDDATNGSHEAPNLAGRLLGRLMPAKPPGMPPEASVGDGAGEPPSGDGNGTGATLDGFPLVALLEEVAQAFSERQPVVPERAARLLIAARAEIKRLRVPAPPGEPSPGEPGPPVAFLYRDGSRETTHRIRDARLRVADGGYVLSGIDLDSGEVRDFAFSGIREVFGTPSPRYCRPRCHDCGDLDHAVADCPDRAKYPPKPAEPSSEPSLTPWLIGVRMPGDPNPVFADGETVMARDEAHALQQARTRFGSKSVVVLPAIDMGGSDV